MVEILTIAACSASSAGGTIKDLKVKQSDIYGRFAGGIADFCDRGTISGCMCDFSIHLFSYDGDEETGIFMMEDVRGMMDDAWYSLDGRMIIGTPTQKGMYIYNGRKMLIK